MKKSFICLLFLLISTMLMGCSADAGNGKTKYRDIVIERTDFPYLKGESLYMTHLGTQFLGEEPIQLWAERYAAQGRTSKIYQLGLDGNAKLLLEGVPDELTLYGENRWYLDLEGCFYYMDGSNLIKMDSQGRELFRTKNDASAAWSIKKMCQAPDKKIYLSIDSKTGYRLAELNADTGDITILEQVETRTDDIFRNSFYLGAGISGPAIFQASIREEDYYPIAFSAWSRGEKIYGICPDPLIYALEADRDILQNSSDIRGITDALLAYQGEAVYLKGMDSSALLRLFLEGSETLWGMIDWEKGTFDFKGELFLDLLQVAQRYGDTPSALGAPENNTLCIAQREDFRDYYYAPSDSELEERGLVLAGWLFDDGCHALATGEPVAISSGSDKKEGAWEFLCFLLGDEAQENYSYNGSVKKSVFDGYADKLLEKIEGDNIATPMVQDRTTGEWSFARIYEEKDMEFIKTEKIPYYKKMLEEARYLPLRSAPILDIICEEAEDYFNGDKSAEEVIKVIENRVKLYVNERKSD